MSDLSHPIPPEEFSGKNISDIAGLLVCDGYSVFEWTPGKDGKGESEMVCLSLHLGGAFDGAEIILRVQSRKELNRLIKMLERHRDSVWPE